MKRSGFAKLGRPLVRKTPLRASSTLKNNKPLQHGGARLATSTPLQRSERKMAPVGARGKRMRQGKVAPNAAEQDWMDRAQAFGCVVCFLRDNEQTPAEIHHLKAGDRRLGHLFSIPLCYAHHRGGAGDGPFISRHPWRSRFESAYGTELELLDKLKSLLIS